MGVTKTLKVMAGDIIRLGTRAWMESKTPPPGGTSPAETVLSAVLGMASGQVSSLSQHGVAAPQLSGSGSPLYGALSLFSGYNGASASQPQAYLNWVLVDEQYGYVPEGSGYVQASSSTGLQTLATGEIEVVKSGYLTVFVSNQSSSYKAYFDNLSIEHRSGPLLAEDDYYPFGLTMAGISSKAANGLENKLKYNGKEEQREEFSDGSGLEALDFSARMYDAQVGRFWQQDPLTEYMRRWSPYSFAFDNPVRFADPSGKAPGDSVSNPINGGELQNVTVIGHIKPKEESGFWGGVGSFLYGAIDYVPFAGSVKQIGEGVYDGDWATIGMGVVMLGVDVFTAGEGGEVLRIGKNLGKELVEQEVKELAEKEFIEQTEKRAFKTFDEARVEAFEKAGIKDGEFDMAKAAEKEDPLTGTYTEFKGENGAKVGYDAPHKSPGPHHDKQHISWQSAGKRGTGGTGRGNIPYDGPRHPSRPTR